MSESHKARPLWGQVKQSPWLVIGLAVGALLLLSACKTEDSPPDEQIADEGAAQTVIEAEADFPNLPECGNGVAEGSEECDGADTSQCNPGQVCAGCQCSDCPADGDTPPCTGVGATGISCTTTGGVYGICGGVQDAANLSDPGQACDCVAASSFEPYGCYGLWLGFPCEAADGGPGYCGPSGTASYPDELFCWECETLWAQCAAGSCVAGTCETDADCSPGQTCDGCICMPTTCPAGSDGCHTDADCPGLEVCDASNCNCFSPTCGDGLKQTGEQCDGYSLDCPAGQICQDNCTCGLPDPAPDCGNGQWDGGECEPPGYHVCVKADSGNVGETMTYYNNHFVCNSVCQCEKVPATIACNENGIVEPYEECDTYDSSSDTWFAETCEPGHYCNHCRCLRVPVCGDGVVDPHLAVNEECDGSSDPCAPDQTCMDCECVESSFSTAPDFELTAMCGNGVVNASENETCDPPGSPCAHPSDVGICSDDCQCVPAGPPQPPLPAPAPPEEGLEGADGSMCGDGVCQAGEKPDWCGDCPAPDILPPDDNRDGGDGDGGETRPQPPVCGNGVIEAGETCDDGSMNGACGFCNRSCTGIDLC